MATRVIYDPTIRDVLKRTDVSLHELETLRIRARDVLKQQGNLAGALIELDEEIKRRRGTAK